MSYQVENDTLTVFSPSRDYFAVVFNLALTRSCQRFSLLVGVQRVVHESRLDSHVLKARNSHRCLSPTVYPSRFSVQTTPWLLPFCRLRYYVSCFTFVYEQRQRQSNRRTSTLGTESTVINEYWSAPLFVYRGTSWWTEA